MHRLHSGLTVAAKIKVGRGGSLKDILKDLNTDTKRQPSVFTNSATTLFVSGVILPEQDYGHEKLPETFVFTTSYSGPFQQHLTDLLQTCGKELYRIFQHCKDFPDGQFNNETLADYLKSHRHTSAFNSRYNCITKQDIQREKDLRREIENYIDKAQQYIDLNALSALEVKSLIQRYIKSKEDEYAWTYKPARKNFIESVITKRVIITIALIIITILFFLFYSTRHTLIFLGIVAVTIMALILFIIKKITKTKCKTAKRPDDSWVRKINATQLHPVINEMTAAAPLKPGNLRRHFYAFALKVVNFMGNCFMNVPTVSHIRWLSIDNKKRLVFISIYSNTTDFYVRDFLNGKTPLGVNFMFTNGGGFPDAEWLRYGGISKDPEGYMNAVHSGQHVTDLWYRHHPELTADIIHKNRKIRNGLFKPMNESEAGKWLKLF